MILILTSCSASKDDSIPIPNGSKMLSPIDYLDSEALITQLGFIRKRIFQNPRSKVGDKRTYAFDLYVRAGNAYRDLRRYNYDEIKELLISGNEVEWFFLSGGYGLIHALEPAVKYQATFNRNIAYQNNIPFTGNLWKDILPQIIDAAFLKFDPEWTYAFGSRDYTRFIKQTNSWSKSNIKMFESTGSAGPYWLSPIINDLVKSITNNTLNKFNEKYDKFTKQ